MNLLIIISASFLLSFSTFASPDCVDCDVQTELKGSVPTSEESSIAKTTSQLLNQKFKGMLTPERCEIFQKTLSNIKDGYLLLPSKTLFDTLSYYHEKKDKSPISNEGRKLLKQSKEFVSIAKECQRKRKTAGSVLWTNGSSERVRKSCSYHLEGLGFHQNLVRDHEAKINNPLVSIGNFDVESDMKRFFVIDTKTGEISASKVSHGRGEKDGKNQSRRLRKCKTRRGSTKDQTRPGFYKVTSRVLKGHKQKEARYKGSYLTKGWPTACHEGTYNPRARRTKCGTGNSNSFFNALRIVGLEDSNDDAYSSGVVMHGASYNPPSPDGFGVAGASQGCPAFNYKDFERIGQSLSSQDTSGSSLYYSYAPVCGDIEKDSGKRVERVYRFKKELTKNTKKINKRLKKILGKTYLKEFKEELKNQGFIFEQFGSINAKYAKAWGKKLKKAEGLSTLEYLQKLQQHLEKQESKSPEEEKAVAYVSSLLQKGESLSDQEESPYIEEYLSACKRI